MFARVAIVGFGLMGGSLGLAVKRRWPASLVIAVDRKDVLEAAIRMHAADVAGDELLMAAEADLIVLAAPVLRNIEILHQLADAVPGTALVTDVGSTKAAIVDAARALPDRLRFIGGHPLAGAAVGGVHAARADLFEHRPWLLVADADDTSVELTHLEQFVGGLGARPSRIDAAEHDRLMAYLSHLPQVAVSALMGVVGQAADASGLALSGRGLRDTTRLASSPASIWRDICATNREPLGAALDELIERLKALRAGLGEPEIVDRIFAEANRWKAAMPPGEE